MGIRPRGSLVVRLTRRELRSLRTFDPGSFGRALGVAHFVFVADSADEGNVLSL